MLPPIRFFLNFAHINYHLHLPYSVAVHINNIPYTHFDTRLMVQPSQQLLSEVVGSFNDFIDFIFK